MLMSIPPDEVWKVMPIELITLGEIVCATLIKEKKVNTNADIIIFFDFTFQAIINILNFKKQQTAMS